VVTQNIDLLHEDEIDVEGFCLWHHRQQV
jgi:hypothetical protein